jgi:hypothetical protein
MATSTKIVQDETGALVALKGAVAPIRKASIINELYFSKTFPDQTLT